MTPSPALLAVLCLITLGLLDLLFKLYARELRSRGMLIFGIGCVWTILHLVYMRVADIPLVVDNATLSYGVVAAILLVASNILLVECLGHLPISMASTIYRLNTIPLVILAYLFLQEDIGWIKGAGIFFGLLTVWLLYQSSDDIGQVTDRFVLFLALIIVASCVRALYGIVTKAGVGSGADPTSMMLFSAFGWAVGGLTYARYRESRVVVNKVKIIFSLIGGALVFVIVWLLVTALTLGDASLVVPLSNMGFVAAMGFAILFRLERMTIRKGVAISSAVISILLLTRAF